MSSRARALQLSFWTSWLTRESRDGVCSRRVQNFFRLHQSFAKAALVR